MKVRELKFEDPEVKKLARELATVLVNLSAENMKGVEVIGTTNSVADTESFFRHALGSVPSLWFPLEGRIYVPRYGLKENEIDVRSGEVSEPFRILVIR